MQGVGSSMTTRPSRRVTIARTGSRAVGAIGGLRLRKSKSVGTHDESVLSISRSLRSSPGDPRRFEPCRRRGRAIRLGNHGQASAVQRPFQASGEAGLSSRVRHRWATLTGRHPIAGCHVDPRSEVGTGGRNYPGRAKLTTQAIFAKPSIVSSSFVLMKPRWWTTSGPRRRKSGALGN